MTRLFRHPGLSLLVTATLLLAAFSVPCAAQPAFKKQILLLNSYHQNFVWNEEIFRGLTDVLRPRESGIILHVENMDTKRVEFNDLYIRQLRDVFAHKYQSMDLDLVLVTDNNAFEFMRRHHDDLFPRVPVIFCGVNFFRQELIADHPLFTGVVESVDAAGTLWWAMRNHPKTSTIYIFMDHTPTGRAVVDNIRDQLKTFTPDVNVIYSGNKPLSDVLAEAEALPKDSLILYGVFNRDSQGRFYDVSEALAALALRVEVPIYGLLDFDLGHGIMGGMLSSGYHQGQSMARIALHVLAGRKPNEIPVLDEGVFAPMFDYNELRKFNIDISDLPEGSEVINRPTSFYSEHARFIWIGVGFTTFQMIIILLLVVNIIRRRQAEKGLRKAQRDLEARVRERTSKMKDSQEALRTVFDSSQDAIFIHDVRGHILEANKGMLKMYGVSADELESISIARDISSRDNPLYRLSAIWRDVLNGTPQNFEWRSRRPHDGTEFDVEIYLNRIVFRGKEAILSNVRDISVRKEAENRIRQTLTKFEAILENTLMGIAMSKGKKILTINSRGAEIFGYTPGELIVASPLALLGSDSALRTFISDAKTNLLKHGEHTTEQEFRDRNGQTVWCRMYAKAIDPASLDKGIIWAWDDVTEHRRAQEDLLRAREEAEAANRAKSEFLAAMSHEIRTPMNAIVGMTDITLQTDLDDNQRDYLKTVQDSARHLLNIINDILDLSKIEARKLELDHADFDLPFHVRSTIKGLEVQAGQKGLNMVLSIDDATPKCIRGDAISLRQILVNLVGNAIKFTHQGTVTVRVFPTDPTLADEDTDRPVGVTFEVEDTGIGIPSEFIDTIFQSFSQTTRAFGGTGLGLAICKQLITLMGGDINVASTVGKGSTFTFTAWFEDGVSCPIPAEMSPDLPGAPTRPVRVLVAEDNDVNVMVTTLKLQDLGYTYSVAGTGLEVLDLLKREPFDIILMDIEMPVLDGISTTKAIRSAVQGGPIPDPTIPIIGVTAHALKEFREKSLDSGMDDYVSKPVDFHELSIIINRLLGGVPAVPKEAPSAMAPPSPPKKPAPEADIPTDSSPDIWTPDAAREFLGVDEATFADFLSAARLEMDTMTDELIQAIAAGEPETVTTLAHTVKSVCRSIGANRAAQAAESLEHISREEGDISPALEDFQKELKELLLIMDSVDQP